LSIPVSPELFDSWTKFVQFASEPFEGKWIFRGVLADWDLESSLERACDGWGVPESERPAVEKRLLREFKRAYPVRAEVPAPKDEDDLAWLALMQHHGAPTRLLDWTFSPYVAAFFALDHLLGSPSAPMAAVWALSGRPVLSESVRELLPSELTAPFEKYRSTRGGPEFRKVFVEADPPVAFVHPVNPYSLNERLVVQQGTFLCPGDVAHSFEHNLLAMLEPLTKLRKILLPRSVLPEAFVGLYRMNITHTTLFPGLDGYARSLRHKIDLLRDTTKFFDATV
jgi:FRG domain